MKKWALLLVFPYMVDVTTSTVDRDFCISEDRVFYTCDKEVRELHSLYPSKDRQWGFGCDGEKSNCEWLYDLAEALNAAHERRANPPPRRVITLTDEKRCEIQKDCEWTGSHCVCTRW